MGGKLWCANGLPRSLRVSLSLSVTCLQRLQTTGFRHELERCYCSSSAEFTAFRLATTTVKSGSRSLGTSCSDGSCSGLRTPVVVILCHRYRPRREGTLDPWNSGNSRGSCAPFRCIARSQRSGLVRDIHRPAGDRRGLAPYPRTTSRSRVSQCIDPGERPGGVAAGRAPWAP